MYRIIDCRGTGKTSRLLLLAKENNGIVVCALPNLMREKAYRYGLTGIDFMSYHEFVQNIKEHKVNISMPELDGTTTEQELDLTGFKIDKPIFIDELEGLFRHLCMSKIMGYTLSTEE